MLARKVLLPWTRPVLGSSKNTCKQCRQTLQTKTIKTPGHTRFQEPYLLVCFLRMLDFLFGSWHQQCFSCCPKWWYFFEDHPKSIPPLSTPTRTSSQMQHTHDIHLIGTLPSTEHRSRRPQRLRTSCVIVVHPSQSDERRECGRIVAKGCDNQTCKPHCVGLGNCRIHSEHAGSLTKDVENISHEVECARGDQTMGGIFMHNNQYEHLIPQDVILPMPLPTRKELHVREQRALNNALALSLQPHPNQHFEFPNSYQSSSGSASSNIASGSGLSSTNMSMPPSSLTSTSSFDTAFASISVTSGSQPTENNTFFTNLYRTAPTSNTQLPTASTHPQVSRTAETSGDRAVGRMRDIQSTSNKLPIATIDARLSHQMHGAWLNEFEAREESQAKWLRDQAQQAALGRRCQRQFMMKFFNAVCDSILMHSIFAYCPGKADEEVFTQLIQDIDDADWPSYPLANHLPDLLGVRFAEVELLDISTRTWFRIRKGHTIPLTSNLHVFIRRLGVKCRDFDYHYNLFVKPPRTPNI